MNLILDIGNNMKHFKDIMKTVLIDRATDINGRSDRPEYWWFTLYATIVYGLCALVDSYVLGFTFFSILEPFGEIARGWSASSMMDTWNSCTKYNSNSKKIA